MEHSYKRRVQFADTDAAGVVHFSRLLCYAEEAEHDLLEKAGIPLLSGGGWPRVHVDCDYLAPVKVGDTVDVTISPVKTGRSSVQWSFSMNSNGTPVARGNMKTVRVDDHGTPVELDPNWRKILTPDP
ncbi:MAG: acyl-CoA thioesterase [Akkermansiaceae bacterium]|nr:acyl-CoA thioesterase [Akkermansiaceae bacterium]